MDEIRNPRLSFKYEACWANEDKARDIIQGMWGNLGRDIVGKIDEVQHRLGK